MQIDFRTYRLLHFAFILFVSLLAVGSLYLLGPEDQPGTHKFLMPGTYFADLKSEKYVGWFFVRWKSKNIQSKVLRFQAEIENIAEHREWRYDYALPSVNDKFRGPDFDRCGRTGYIGFSVKIDEPGTYKIKCDQNCVFILVPSNQLWVYESSDTAFPGVFDDSNFSKPERHNYLCR